MKARVTSGATGVASGVKEHELTLEIALLLRTELESRGYTVLLTRETHDVNISNMERAQMAGMILLFALLIWANFNDVVRFLF